MCIIEYNISPFSFFFFSVEDAIQWHSKTPPLQTFSVQSGIILFSVYSTVDMKHDDGSFAGIKRVRRTFPAQSALSYLCADKRVKAHLPGCICYLLYNMTHTTFKVPLM